MTEGMLAREALEVKEKWDFARRRVCAALSSSGEFDALSEALAAGEEDEVQFERGLRSALLAGTAEALSARLSARDAARERPRCGSCGSAMARRGTRRFSPLSLFGRLELARGYWTCRCSKGGRHPLDEALGVCGRDGVRLTPGALWAIGEAAAETSCARAAERLERTAEVRTTAKRAERAARRLGREIADADEAAAEEAPAAAPAATMYCSPDGAGVPVRREEAGEGKDGGVAATTEAKVATFHTAERRNVETGRPESDPGSVRHTAKIDSAKSKDADPKPSAFAERLWSAARRFGFAAASRQVVVADGAKWIWNVVSELFPDAIEIVDIWHAKERLWRAAAAVCGQGTDLCRAWAEKLCAALSEGRIDDVLAALGEHAENREAAKCAGYVENNRARMRYPKFRAMGLQIGSGMVESACGVVVGQRLKCGGMRWSVDGANDVMALRTCCGTADTTTSGGTGASADWPREGASRTETSYTLA